MPDTNTNWIIRDAATKQRHSPRTYTESEAKTEVQRLLTESQQSGQTLNLEAVPLLMEA